MVFTFPLWLFALIPWAGVVLWLLWGRRRKTPVPFLELWRGPALQKPVKRAIQPPAVFLALAIVAMLLAVLAAARPSLHLGHGGAGKPVTIIVDRGISMSAMSGGVPRFQLTAKHASGELAKTLDGATPVDLLALPGQGSRASDIDAWAANLAQLSPTAIDTQAALEEAVRGRLANGSGPVVVISDRRLPFDDPRLVQFSPEAPVENVGIVRVAARETPSAEVMVRLRNDSNLRMVGVKVASGAEIATRTVDLPPRGQERDYFFDPAKLESDIEASLDVADDQPADNRAWLVREGSYPKIEVRMPMPAELRRMIEVYARSRPPIEGAPVVAIVGAETDLPSDAPAVWIAPAAGPKVQGVVTTIAHPVTADLRTSAFPSAVQTAGEMPRGWTPLVSIDGHPIVAIRSEPTRKAWIGFEAPNWSSTPEFVIFWANVLTWAGNGQERFAAYPLATLEPGWKPVEPSSGQSAAEPGFWPGLYRTDEGAIRAYNPPKAVAGEQARTTADWRQRLTYADGPGKAGNEFGPVLLVLAVMCLIGAAMTWKSAASRSGRRFSSPVSRYSGRGLG